MGHLISCPIPSVSSEPLNLIQGLSLRFHARTVLSDR
jgi:hypothetical protein